MDKISINPVEGTPPAKVSVLPTKPDTAIDSKTALTRSQKIDFALGPEAPSVGATYTALMQGREDQLREITVLNEQAKLADARASLVSSMFNEAASQGRTLSESERSVINSMTAADFQEASVDKGTVFEKKYAQRVMDTAMARDEANPFTEFVSHAPDAAYIQKGHFEDQLTKNEIFKRLSEEQRQRSAKQNWVGWGIDVLKSFVPGYTWSKWTSVNSPNDVPGWLPGTEKAEVVRYIHSLPPAEAARQAKGMIDRLNYDNPQMANELADAFVQYTQTQEYADNILIPGFDAAVVLPTSLAIKGIKGLAKGAASATGKLTDASINLAKGMGTFEVSEAVKGLPELAKISSGYMRDFAQAVMRPKAGLDDAADALGDTVQGGLYTSIKNIMPEAMDSWEKVAKMVPSVFNPAEITATAGKFLSKKSVESIENMLRGNADLLVKKLLLDPLARDRLDPQMIEVATEEIKERLTRTIGGAHNAILDVKFKPVENTVGDARMAVVQIGDSGGQLFETAADATMTAKITYGLGKFEIEPKGNGYLIHFTTGVDETAPIYRRGLKDYVTRNPTPAANKIGELLRKFRTPDDTLPEDIVRAFNDVGYGMAGAKGALSEIFRGLSDLKLGKESLDAFDRFTRKQQMTRSRLNHEKMGDSSPTLRDFEEDWFATFERAPTEGEAKLYFQMAQLNDMVFAGENIRGFMGRTRAGYSNWSFKQGEKFGLNDVEGKMITELPPEAEANNLGIMIIKEDEVGVFTGAEIVSTRRLGRQKESLGERVLTAAEKSRRDRGKPTKADLQAELDFTAAQAKAPTYRQIIKDMMNDGYQLIQVSRIGTSKILQTPELSAVIKDRPDVNFILAKTTENQPLPLNTIPYTEGFRFMPAPKSVFASQPIVGVSKARSKIRVYGDRNLYQFSSQADADMLIPRLNEARKLFLAGIKNNGDFSTFKAYARANLPGDIRRTLMKDFAKGMKNAGDGVDPRVPIMSRGVGQSLEKTKSLDDVLNAEWGTKYGLEQSDTVGGGYESTTNMGAALERGDAVWRLENKGSTANPIWSREMPDVISARDSVEQMMSSYLRSTFSDDVKFQTAERFIAEFGGVMNPDRVALHKDPVQLFLDKKVFKEGLTGEDAVTLNKAQNFQQRAVSFLGIKSPEVKQQAYLIDKMVGDIDKRFGEGYLKPLVDILKDYNEGRRDAASILRSFAFHSKIGMFNPRQLFLQPMTIARMAGMVGPTSPVVKQTAGALWHMGVVADRGLTKLIPTIEKNLKEWGWEKGWFEEALKVYERSGFNEVKNSNVYLSDHLDFRSARTATGRFFLEDEGLTFFTAGEKLNRRAAIMASYLEWRNANKLAKLTDSNFSMILKRADNLNQNMGHQSRAAWQEGLWSVPTQFLGYTVRGMEQMMGKRLSTEEKLRIVGTHSVLFGMPISVAGATGFFPANDIYNRAAIASGYDVNANAISSIFSDGLLGYGTQILAGEPTNISERFGPNASTILWDTFFKDEPVAEFMAGPGGSTVVGFADALKPVVPWLWNAIQGDVTVKPRALFEVLSANISSFSAADKIAMGWFTGAYYSKRSNDLIAEDRQALQTFFEGFIGFDPKKVDMVYDIQAVLRSKSDLQRKMTPSMRSEIRKIMDVTNPADSQALFDSFRAKSIAGGFTEDQVNRLISDELKGKPQLTQALDRLGKVDADTNAFVEDMKKKYNIGPQ